MSATITIDNEAGDEGVKPGAQITIDEGTLAPDDAAALADTKRALNQTTQQLTAAQQERQQTQNENARLRDQAARERQGRAADRKAVWAQAVESADAELTAAKANKRMARDAGDVDAEMNAEEAIAAAGWRKADAAGKLAALAEEPEPTTERQAPQRQQTQVPSPRVQQFFVDHSRMNTDEGYKRTAIAVHDRLEAAGVTEATDPERYFGTIHAELSKVYGDNHSAHSGADTTMRSNSGNGGNRGSEAAPSNRGGGNSSASQVITLASGLGKVRVQHRQDGTIARLAFLDQASRENMDEGAKICYPSEYSKDPQAAIAAYTAEQVKIAQEIAMGSNAGLVVGEGGTFR